MALEFTSSYLDDARPLFRHYKRLADAAIAQLHDEQLYVLLDPDANSIAIIVKHLAGNMKSRWTDFLTSDGEKPNRNRDSEFVEPPTTRAELLRMWEDAWICLFTTLDPFSRPSIGSSPIRPTTAVRLCFSRNIFA